jgi:hypothetical protein
MEKEKKSLSFLPQDYKNLIIGLAVALIVGLITAVVYQGKKMSALEEKINSTQEIVKLTGVHEKIQENKNQILEKALKEIPDPKEKLFGYIVEYQSIYVKKSTGTFDYNCFTDSDLLKFHDRDTPKQIESKLLHDTEFLALVLAIKNLTPEQWGNIKREALLIYRPTFAEAGGVKSDGSAQSAAGQQAEQKVAETIVNLVSTLKKKDKSEIVEMID